MSDTSNNPRPPEKRRKRPFLVGLKVVLGLGLLVGAFHFLDPGQVGDALKKANPGVLILVALLLMVGFPLLGYRWYVIIRHVASLDLYEHQRRYLLATYFNNFTPAQLGGDIYRFFHSNDIPTSAAFWSACWPRSGSSVW